MSAAAGTIVVGYDGSKHSQSALHWAERQAKATGSPVKIVVVWHWPAVFGTPIGLGIADIDPERDANALARDASGELDLPMERIRVQVSEGAAGPTLVEAAADADADLLVVGARGHNPLQEMLLGSVGDYCVRRSQIPVVVIR